VTLTVDVTDGDIAGGDHAADSCPVARAANRALPRSFRSLVAKGFLYVLAPGDRFSVVSLPPAAVLAVNLFDRTDRMDPFRFEVEVRVLAETGS
jgi:hypothetical protein